MKHFLADFHYGCIGWPSYKQSIRDSLSSYPHLCFLSLVTLMLAIMAGLWCNMKSFFYLYFPVAKDVEHFFKYASPLCISCFEKCLFHSLSYLLIGWIFLSHFFFGIQFLEYFIDSRYMPPVRRILCRKFSLLFRISWLWCQEIPLVYFLWHAETFYYEESYL